jgi:hypothetical protein
MVKFLSLAAEVSVIFTVHLNWLYLWLVSLRPKCLYQRPKRSTSVWLKQPGLTEPFQRTWHGQLNHFPFIISTKGYQGKLTQIPTTMLKLQCQ